MIEKPMMKVGEIRMTDLTLVYLKMRALGEAPR